MRVYIPDSVKPGQRFPVRVWAKKGGAKKSKNKRLLDSTNTPVM